MSLSLADLSSTILSWILVYGAVILFVAILLGAIGVPLPCTFLLLAAGAFVRQEVLDLTSVLAWALLGALIGDSLSYGIGRIARRPLLRRFGGSSAWRSAEDNLKRRGGVAIYLTRWLLTAIAVPTNLVAGSAGYSYTRFLLFGAAGEITWLLVYGGLGYAFSDQWETISDLISDFGGLLVGALIVVIGVVVLLRTLVRSPKKEPKPSATPSKESAG
jgi:membrane-associated protein